MAICLADEGGWGLLWDSASTGRPTTDSPSKWSLVRPVDQEETSSPPKSTPQSPPQSEASDSLSLPAPLEEEKKEVRGEETLDGLIWGFGGRRRWRRDRRVESIVTVCVEVWR